MVRMILLLIAASSDSDIYMLEKGATTNRLRTKPVLSHSLVFALMGVLMVLAGLNIGKLILNEKLYLFHEMITIILFLVISAVILVRTFRKESVIERLEPTIDYHTTFKQSLITGIDFLLIGVILSSEGFSYFSIVAAVFFLNLISSLSAACMGYYLGAGFQKLFGYLSALIYFVVANIELISLVL